MAAALLLAAAMAAAPAGAQADAPSGVPAEITAQAAEQRLHEERLWRNLLRYEPRAFRPGRRGGVSSPGFYLAEAGRDDPAAELHATLEALYEPPDGEADDAHAACRYPARRRFLVDALGLDDRAPEHRPPDVVCPGYEEWRDAVDARRVVLVFADAYMGNPASMFGHTLLRLDSERGTQHPLASFAVNHAAQTEEDSGVIFAMRGILGGYPGRYSVLQYYDKVNEYNHLEDRDLWEYELDLEGEQVERLVAHLWELREALGPYYFFYQNCSFRLLMLLEAADPDLRVTDAFSLWAIPTDTVRAVAETPGLVRAARYRPSSGTRLRHAVHGLETHEAVLARELGRGERSPADDAVQALPAERRARVLETGYDYMNHLAKQDEIGEEAREGRHELLVARSRVDAPPPEGPPTPEVRPDEGHGTVRAGIGFGAMDGVGFASLEGRLAYHDLLDPPGGYLTGSEIALLDTELRYHRREEPRRAPTADEGLELERVTLVGVRSLAPRSGLFRPWSWGTEAAVERLRAPDGGRSLMPVARTSFGPAWSLFDTRRLVVHPAIDAELRGGGRLDDNYRAGLGGRLELLHLGEPFRFRAKVRRVAFHDERPSWTARVEAGWTLQRQWALRAGIERQEDFGVRTDHAQLRLHHYF